MATLPALNYVSNSARTQGEVKTALEDTNTFIRTLFGSDTDTATMPIANNSIPPSKLALGAWTTVASAATVNLGAQTSRNIVISGTTGITSFGSTATPDNVPFNIRFSGSLTLTHSANLICPGAANLSVVAGDLITVVQITTGTWVIVAYSLATLPAINGSQLTNVVKAWASFRWNGSSVVIDASYNVSSVTRNGLGDYTVNFTNAFPNVYYGMFGYCADILTGSLMMSPLAPSGFAAPTTKTTSQIRIRFGFQGSPSSGADPTSVNGLWVGFF